MREEAKRRRLRDRERVEDAAGMRYEKGNISTTTRRERDIEREEREAEERQQD